MKWQRGAIGIGGLATAFVLGWVAAGLNLPARSVLLTTLVKGPRDKKRLIDASAAQQMFGRAGRPQFDSEGHVFALAHEDDVKLARWREKYDSIPEETKDPGLMKAKKALLKKKPKPTDQIAVSAVKAKTAAKDPLAPLPVKAKAKPAAKPTDQVATR